MIIAKTEEFDAMLNGLDNLIQTGEELVSLLNALVSRLDEFEATTNNILDGYKDEEDIGWNPIVPDIQVG